MSPETWERIAGYLPRLAEAALVTIRLSVLSLVLATVLALLVAIGLRSRQSLVRAPIVAYVQVGRAVPELVQVFVWYYVLPDFGVILDAGVAGVLALGFAFAPYLGEVFRAGIDAVDRAQWEAAEVLGMRRLTLWRRCVLPQALRIVLPVWTGYFISIFKATSLLSFITVPELFSVARERASQNFRYLELFALVMAFYLAMGYPTVWLLRRLERRWDTRHRLPNRIELGGEMA